MLIIGAGASGAALAWSLAATRMNILCMEPGDWMDPSQYPGMRTDWEARQMGDFSFSPNTRGRQEDHPVNDGSSPIQVSRYNGVADAWPLAYQTLAPCYDVTARMMGVYDRQSIPIRRS